MCCYRVGDINADEDCCPNCTARADAVKTCYTPAKWAFRIDKVSYRRLRAFGTLDTAGRPNQPTYTDTCIWWCLIRICAIDIVLIRCRGKLFLFFVDFFEFAAIDNLENRIVLHKTLQPCRPFSPSLVGHIGDVRPQNSQIKTFRGEEKPNLPAHKADAALYIYMHIHMYTYVYVCTYVYAHVNAFRIPPQQLRTGIRFSMFAISMTNNT